MCPPSNTHSFFFLRKRRTDDTPVLIILPISSRDNQHRERKHEFSSLFPSPLSIFTRDTFSLRITSTLEFHGSQNCVRHTRSARSPALTILVTRSHRIESRAVAELNATLCHHEHLHASGARCIAAGTRCVVALLTHNVDVVVGTTFVAAISSRSASAPNSLRLFVEAGQLVINSRQPGTLVR